MRIARLLGSALAGALLALATPGLAQVYLPGSDASLERSHRQTTSRHDAVRRHQRSAHEKAAGRSSRRTSGKSNAERDDKASVSEEVRVVDALNNQDVPHPEARPKPEEAAEGVGTGSAATSPEGNSEKASAEAPKEQNRDMPKVDEPESPSAADDAGKSGSNAEASNGTAAPVKPAEQEQARTPVEKSDTPVADIPLPEKRPSTPEPSPSVSEKSDDAPNSPDKLRSRVPEVTPADAVLAAAAIDDAKGCEAELTKRGVKFTVGESISDGECGVLRPIDVTELSSGVSVKPGTKLLCRTVLALDRWVSDSVALEAKRDFQDRQLSGVSQVATYVCRPRASESGISEHARGSAIDIGGFVFDNGSMLGVKAQTEGSAEARFQKSIRDAACGPFRTVLGPGTDSDHATHFHLDMDVRKRGATYCH